MTSQVMEVEKVYTQATFFSDCNHELIQKKAEELTQDISSKVEAAVKIFNFVRDGILFGADRYDLKASDTLRHGLGLCISKANLQIALLRAAGIPARYHQVTAKRDALKGIVADFAYNTLPEGIWCHPWCECFLGGKWLSCESLFDSALNEKALKTGIFTKEQIPTID